ncbi:hypothetical protein PIB30_064342 [Stylosanthes scabra]|uniref:Uncharacterized protein n=1 Tax=Stylosanthes scabra TaxID=79078 RepID=A0ABU6ZKC8_9FABA|nr:hypothetical protein [Stylosanthes scabra]
MPCGHDVADCQFHPHPSIFIQQTLIQSSWYSRPCCSFPTNDLHDLIHVQFILIILFPRSLELAFSFKPWEVEDIFYLSEVARDLPSSHEYLSLILLIAICIEFSNQHHVDINCWIVHEIPSSPSNVFSEVSSAQQPIRPFPLGQESHILQLLAKVNSEKMNREFLLRVALQHFFLFRPSTKHGGYKSDQEEASNN